MNGKNERKTIKEIFPEVKSFIINVTERVPGLSDPLSTKSTQYSENSYLNEMVPCSWPQCHNGGVRVGDIIRGILAERKEEYEETLLCGGYWGSPKGRVKYENHCNRYFIVKASVRYV